MNKYFTIRKAEDITVITFLFAELSLKQIEEFKSLFYCLVTDADNKFVINMRMCSFLPSLVLGVLVGFDAKVKKENGRMVFCCLTEQVRTILEITRLVLIFEVYNTEEAALSAFHKK